MKFKKLKKHIRQVGSIQVDGYSELGEIPVKSVSHEEIEKAADAREGDDPSGLDRDYRLIALMVTDDEGADMSAAEAKEICKIQSPKFRTNLMIALMAEAGITSARGK